MPHSGGGGSHGGGFHSGGSHHSSSGGSSGPRISKSYYAGSHRYVYYHHGRCYNYYSTSMPTNSRAGNIFASIFVLIFVLIGFVILFFSVEKPKKISNSNYQSAIIDTNNVFSNKNDVLDVLKDFTDKTGLVVYIETIEYEDRNDIYTSLENCAYDRYVSTFNTNEKCLYIMYEYSDTQYDYWAFETMYGDDTNVLFVGNREKEFTKSIDTNLRIYSLDEAFINTFSDTSFMNKTINYEMVFMAVLWIGISSVIFVFALINIKKMSHMSKAKEVKDINEKPEKCEYCGCEYFVSTVDQCPHCGAGIKYKNE